MATQITELPAVPSRNAAPDTFSDDADLFLSALPKFRTEVNLVAAEIEADASTASSAASTATTQANTATTQAGIATTQANTATTKAAEALASANAAAASYDSFDDRYLGTKSSNPTVDNDGNSLLVGAMYWNTSVGELRFHAGSGVWVTPSTATNNFLPNTYLSGRIVNNPNDEDVEGVRAGYITTSATNKPTGTDHAMLSMAYSNLYAVQIAGDWRTNEWYVRGQNNGTWGSWASLVHSGNVSTITVGSANTSTTQDRSVYSTAIATTQYVKNLFGAAGTTGTLDWNDVSNIRPGTGPTLLMGNATNGPGIASYFHTLNFEYASKDGTGNITQLAISYANHKDIYFRGRMSGTWNAWTRILTSDNYNSYSPTLTGTGASGTWAINVTGTAKGTDVNNGVHLGFRDSTNTLRNTFGIGGDNFVNIFNAGNNAVRILNQAGSVELVRLSDGSGNASFAGNVDAAAFTTNSLVHREIIQTISTNTVAVRSRTYILLASLTLTLPSSPSAGDWVTVSNRSSTVTAVIGRNGQNIMGLAEDMTINTLHDGFTLVFTDSTRGWVLV